MNRPVKATTVRLSAIVHATEDPAKVITAMSHVFPDGMPRPKGQRVRGHYGNEIRTLESVSHNSKVAEKFLSTIWNSLPPLDKQEVLSNIGQYVSDAAHLYLRVDKQIAFHGAMRLGQSEPIRVEIDFEIGKESHSGQAPSIISRKLEELLSVRY